MAELRAFRALRYNPAVVPNLAAVVAPPYDVIGTAQRDALYARDQRNVVRLILNRSTDPYGEAAALLRAWRQEQVLVQDRQPALCYCVETFTLPDGTPRQRAGVMGVVRLEPFTSGRIRPHERTFASAKEDRMRLLQACRTNLSPIFGLFADAETALDPGKLFAAAHAPDVEVRDDSGAQQRLWLLREPAVIEAITGTLAAETIYIADGHHRYETALAYAEQRRAAGAADADAAHNFVMMYLAGMHDPGLVILPTHRVCAKIEGVESREVLTRLRQHFHMRPFPGAERAAFRAALGAAASLASFGLALAGHDELFVATLEDRAALMRVCGHLHPSVRVLDVAVLDSLVLRGLLGIDCTAAAQGGRLTYTHDDDSALDAVVRGAQAAFLVNPPRISDLLAVCRAGQTMPEKSTYFFPKLLTGLAFHPLDETAG